MAKSKYYQKPEDRAAILAKAVELARIDPRLSDRQLFIRAQAQALPPERRRATETMPRSVYAWLSPAVMERLRPETKPQPAVPEPSPVAPEPSPRDVAHSAVDRLFDQGQAVARLDSHIAELRDELSAVRTILLNQGEVVRKFHGVLTKILGDLGGYEVEQAQPSPAPEPPKKKRIKVGLLGPLADQVRIIRERINGAAEIVPLDKSHNVSVASLTACDFVVISRHAKQVHFIKATGTVGRDRAIRLPTGGLDAITAKVKELVAARA